MSTKGQSLNHESDHLIHRGDYDAAMAVAIRASHKR